MAKQKRKPRFLQKGTVADALKSEWKDTFSETFDTSHWSPEDIALMEREEKRLHEQEVVMQNSYPKRYPKRRNA